MGFFKKSEEPSLLTVVLVISIVAESAASLFSSRVLGGENAVITEYPYLVSVELVGHYTCGGAIVNDRYVVTTASCVNDSTPAYVTVRAATSLQGQTGEVYQVNKVVVHEKYPESNGTLAGYDVAVMRVDRQFDFSIDECKPAQLFNSSELAAPGTLANLTSWGGAGKPSIQMQLVRLNLIDRATCVQELAKRGDGTKLADKGQICAVGQAGKAACLGDIGSPLAIDERLVGLAAWGFDCTQSTGPAVFTEIAFFREWIDEHAAF